jgi:hypothetical protein
MLKEGSIYYVRVLARNPVGWSAEADAPRIVADYFVAPYLTDSATVGPAHWIPQILRIGAFTACLNLYRLTVEAH